MAAAQIAVRDGIPARIAIQALQALGATFDEQTFYRLYGQAELARSMVGPTGEAPIDQLPDVTLIQHRSTVSSTGFQYQFSVSTVDLETGEQADRYYSIVTPELITPEEGMDAAVVAQTNFASQPGSPSGQFRVLGARLTGIYRLVPGV